MYSHTIEVIVLYGTIKRQIKKNNKCWRLYTLGRNNIMYDDESKIRREEEEQVKIKESTEKFNFEIVLKDFLKKIVNYLSAKSIHNTFVDLHSVNEIVTKYKTVIIY